MLLQPRAIQLPLGRLNQAAPAWGTVWALNHHNATLDGHQTIGARDDETKGGAALLM